VIRTAHHVLVALVVGFACSPASAQTESSVTIHVDANATGTPLEAVWPYFGYDEANYTTTQEAKVLLRTLATIHPTPVRVRTHFLFNTGDGTPALKWGSTNLYTEDENGAPVYDYTIVDQIMDATIQAGTYPLFEIGFMPRALSAHPDPYENTSPYVLDGGSFYPPTDYEKWAGLVAAWAEHAGQRYDGSQTHWVWELWNEPDIGYFQGTVDEYARLYDYTEAALHDVLPDAPLGGPAVARPGEAFLTEFLEHCATGTNAVTGATGTRLDRVSFHAKGGVTLVDGHVQMDLGNQLRLHRTGFEAVAASEQFANTPILITEADPDGCAACPSSTARHLAYRNSPAYGAYEVAMMKRSLDLAEQMGVDLDGVLTWAFTFPGTPYFAGYRALATNGIHLPVLNAFKLLARMSGERLPVTSSGAMSLDTLLENGVRDEPDIDALASRDGERINILVWNYHDDLVDAEPAKITLDVSVPPPFAAGAIVKHQRVDHAHGDAFTVWQSQGSPASPSGAQFEALHEAMDALEFSPQTLLSAKNGAVTLSFALPRFGVSLVTLTPAARNEPSPNDAVGCSYRVARREQTPPITLLLVLALLAIALTRRRYRGSPPCHRGVAGPTG